MNEQVGRNQIDEAFRAKRVAQEEQAQRVHEKRELSLARTEILESVRNETPNPALAVIGEAPERNECQSTGGRRINEAGSRPGLTPGQAESSTVSAVAAFSDPSADAFRVTV